MSSIDNRTVRPEGAAISERVPFRANNEGGQWRIQDISAIIGPELPGARYLHIGDGGLESDPVWTLSAFVSNLRYTTSLERQALQERQAGLGRAETHHAVLIPIRKNPAWWSMAQDERREIYTRSDHTPIGLDYLPAIARQLHHCRDLGEPFDFLTWFEFANSEKDRFRELLARLRATEEWSYVDREVEVWLTR